MILFGFFGIRKKPILVLTIVILISGALYKFWKKKKVSFSENKEDSSIEFENENYILVW